MGWIRLSHLNAAAAWLLSAALIRCPFRPDTVLSHRYIRERKNEFCKRFARVFGHSGAFCTL
jgi:hypothetical protein